MKKQTYYWLPKSVLNIMGTSNIRNTIPINTKVIFQLESKRTAVTGTIIGVFQDCGLKDTYVVKINDRQTVLALPSQITDIAIPTPKWLTDIFKLIKQNNYKDAIHIWKTNVGEYGALNYLDEINSIMTGDFDRRRLAIDSEIS